MKNSKTFRERKTCECTEAPFLPTGWVHTECPFAVRPGRAVQREGRPMEFYKMLECSCGKEVGEVQFSGSEPGKWRLFEERAVAEEKLTRFREYMQTEIFKELLPTLQKMGKIEKAVFFAALMYERMA